MNIPNICTSISENLSHNLRLSRTDDERQKYLYAALRGIDEKVITCLNRLLAEKGEGSLELDEARAAALNLTTFICIDFIRKCTDYRWGISCLEEITANCREPQLKKKLVIYTNQLKRKWNNDEPGGITHSPRARRVRPHMSVSKPFANALRITLLLGSALYFFTHIDLTTLIFPRWDESRQTESVAQMPERSGPETARPAEQPEPVQPLAQGLPPQPVTSSAGFYSFTDEQGVVHIVDDSDKVPQKYRQRMTVTRPSESRSNITSVVIKGNQVLVPLTLSYHGRLVDTQLLLDTGATITTISERLASRLGIDASDLRAGKATVADGRSIGSYSFVADSLTVGSRSLPRVQASILPGSGGDGYDGLLGMNFLKNFRYHIDFNRGVIEWGG